MLSQGLETKKGLNTEGISWWTEYSFAIDDLALGNNGGLFSWLQTKQGRILHTAILTPHYVYPAISPILLFLFPFPFFFLSELQQSYNICNGGIQKVISCLNISYCSGQFCLQPGPQHRINVPCLLVGMIPHLPIFIR